MPPFDYSGFTNIGRGVADTIAEKKKRDKEREDRERTARMLAQYGFPMQTIGDVAAGADPGLAIGLVEDQEKKLKEQDKLKAEAQARDAETKEFDSRMSQFGAQYPLSPEQQSVKSAYPDKTPEQQDSYFGDLAKTHQKSQTNAMIGQLERDPSRRLSASEIEALYPNDKGKVIGYTGRTYADIKGSEQPKPEKPDKPDAYTQRLNLKLAEALARQSVDTQDRIESRWKQAVASAQNVAPPSNVPLSIWGSQLPENDPTKTAYYNLRSADIQAALADAYRGLLDPDAMDVEVENERKTIDALKKRVTALGTFLED